MSKLAERITRLQVATDEVAVFSLGQAGFVFKTAGGQIIYVDPYLSDAAERLHGFRRLMPSPIRPEEVTADVIISTHEHADHLDPEALPVIAGRTEALFVGTPTCLAEYEKIGIPSSRVATLKAGEELEFEGLRITAVPADHGDLAPDAIGVMLDLGGLSIYHTGDTAFRPKLAQPVADRAPYAILPVINGAFGNMTPEEAASLTALVGAKVAIPTHWGMFAEHGGDPEAFRRACVEAAPQAEVVVLQPGQFYRLSPGMESRGMT